MATRKCIHIYFPKYFMAPSESSQIFIISQNIFVLLFILMVGSRSIHYSSFASYMPLPHKKATNRLTVA